MVKKKSGNIADFTIQQVMASKAHNVLVTRRAFSNAPISLLSSINEFKPQFNFNFKCYLID